MWTDAVTSHFERLRQTKPGYYRARCPCPGHRNGDRNPSLSIWLGRQGFLLIRCWRGCPLPEILERVGLKMGDLFPPEESGPYERCHHRLVAAPSKPAREVKTYDYTDEAGEFLYQVVRTEPKGFYQRIKDPYGRSKDGWYPGLGDIRRVLYRLPRIVNSDPSLPVVVCEGEEDVHAAEGLGLVATTNCGGTGMGWRSEYSLCLRGRRVVVIPDNDAPGHRHAEAVVGSLIRHGALSVRLACLPGVGPAGDLRDWLKLNPGAGLAGLAAVIRSAPEYRVI